MPVNPSSGIMKEDREEKGADENYFPV